MTKVLFFAPDLREVAQQRRIRGFRAAGCEVASISFKKRNGQIEQIPDWANLHLGDVAQGRLILRALRGCLSVPKILKNIRMIRRADIIIARNFDMLCLAYIARLISGSRARLVYECLDIHNIFLGSGQISRCTRALERVLLDRIDAMVVSSPAFATQYFQAWQKYTGPWYLLENKLWFDEEQARPQYSTRNEIKPLTLGWVGSLRCKPSFDLLMSVAERMGNKIAIEFHGDVHRHVIKDFDERVERAENVSYHGCYSYPHDLANVYERLDLVWAQDMWQHKGNSKWLLPNRLYEAGWFGCPSIAVAGTQTARQVSHLKLGCVIPHPDRQNLTELLSSITHEDLCALRSELLRHPECNFLLTGADYQNLIQFLSQPVDVCDDVKAIWS